MRVKLLSFTPNPNQLIFAAGRQCYSGGWIGDMFDEGKFIADVSNKDIDNLISYLKESGHTSVLEHTKFTFAVDGVSRSLTHQLVRHRIASYCVSSDTKIATNSDKTNNKTIMELFKLKEKDKNDIKLKCVNEHSLDIVYDKCNEIVFSGTKEVFEVVTENSYKLKATKLHRFLTGNGWKRLDELTVGDYVFVNVDDINIIESKIMSINKIGYEDTYDIVMGGSNHNFIANGFVVHNSQQSQRYVNLEAEFDVNDFVVPPKIMGNNDAYNVYNDILKNIQDSYNTLIQLGIEPEDARYVLPNASITRIVVTMNCVALLHFFGLRCCKLAQWEIRNLAYKMLDICKDVLPSVFDSSGSRCVSLGYCPESKSRSCGKYPTKKEVLEVYKSTKESQEMVKELIDE